MPKGFYEVPLPKNEPVLNYAPGSKERALLKQALKDARSHVADIPMYIGSEEVRTGNKQKLTPPHDHQHVLGYYHEGDRSHVEQAVQAALNARELWANMGWEHRASIFLKAAELLAGPYRYKINAATMLGQSKNAYQAEIDSACELIDFLRFNVYFMSQIYQEQPQSSPGVWNRIEYRPLEGFTLAVTPFNFTAIAGNLPGSMALMGNTVVWKAANVQIYAANVIMEVFRRAGLPDGVINLIYADGPLVGEVVFNHPDFAGLHFTGSTGVFRQMWRTIGENIHKYKSYPRIVGETGGKDFIMVHKSANAREVATGIVRGAFEYQGQKCSAASRCYVPDNLWDEVKKFVVEDLRSFKMGPSEDFGNFINAVISEKAFDSITGFIDLRPSLIVCAGASRPSKWLLSNNRARRLIVYIKIAGGMGQLFSCEFNGKTVVGENRPGECVGRRAVNQLECLFEIFGMININSQHGPEYFLTHGCGRRVLGKNDSRLDKVSLRLVVLSA